MKGNKSGWKGESRRHSLARKGIKTGDSSIKNIKCKGEIVTPSNASPFFEYDLSKHNLPIIRDLFEDPEYNDRRRNRTYDVILMTTDEYLDAIRFGSKQKIQVLDFKLNPIIKDMEKGDKFSMPFLEYDMSYGKPFLRQEGIHRTIASKDLGYELIPVVVIYPSTVADYRKISYMISDDIKSKLDKTKIRSHEERRQDYETKYGRRWDY